MNETTKSLALVTLVFTLAQMSIAAERPLALKPSEDACFERTYSADHLKKHPKQSVRWIRVEHARSSGEFNHTEIKTKFIGDHRLFSGFGTCQRDEKAGRLVCAIDCDGGTYTLSERDDGKIVLRPTDRIRVVACGGDEDDDRPYRQIMAADDQDAFVLERMPKSRCMLKPID